MSLGPPCPGQGEYPTGKEGHAGEERQETLAVPFTANPVPSSGKDHAMNYERTSIQDVQETSQASDRA